MSECRGDTVEPNPDSVSTEAATAGPISTSSPRRSATSATVVGLVSGPAQQTISTAAFAAGGSVWNGPRRGLRAGSTPRMGMSQRRWSLLRSCGVMRRKMLSMPRNDPPVELRSVSAVNGEIDAPSTSTARARISSTLSGSRTFVIPPGVDSARSAKNVIAVESMSGSRPATTMKSPCRITRGTM